MKDELTIRRIAPVDMISRNRRLITRDVWEKAMENYRNTHQDDSIPVTLGSRIYDADNLTMQEVQSIDPSTVVGNTTSVRYDEIDTYIKSDAKRDMVKDLVNNHNYVVGCRMIGKVKLHHLSPCEKEKYETNEDMVSKITDIKIISFDIMPEVKV